MADDGRVIFESGLSEVEGAVKDAVLQWLEEAAGELQGDIVKLSRRRTGQTAASYAHVVDPDRLEALVGSNLENAVWEELGTGEYALNGDGRKGGWVYRDVDGRFHHTLGKHPNRPIFRAFSYGAKKVRRGLAYKLKALEER